MKAKTIKEHDRVVLKSDLPAEGLKAGDVGTVVHIYQDGLAYEVEFTALNGDTVAVATGRNIAGPSSSRTRNNTRSRIAAGVSGVRLSFGATLAYGRTLEVTESDGVESSTRLIRRRRNLDIVRVARVTAGLLPPFCQLADMRARLCPRREE
jgi:hypothetical protein